MEQPDIPINLLERLEKLHTLVSETARTCVYSAEYATLMQGNPLGDLQEAARRLGWCCREMRGRVNAPS